LRPPHRLFFGWAITSTVPATSTISDCVITSTASTMHLLPHWPRRSRANGFIAYGYRWIYLLWIYKYWPDAFPGRWLHHLCLSMDLSSMAIYILTRCTLDLVDWLSMNFNGYHLI
jgi:hypothetical protein